MATIEEFLAQTGIPEAGLKPITDKVEEFVKLVTQSDKWIAEINAASAKDPNNVEFLDSLWKAEQAANNPKVVEIANRFDAVAEEYERLNKQLREIAKENFVPDSLSEDEIKAKRKSVNEAAPAIATARTAAASMLAIPESVLSAMGIALPEGGLASLLPQAKSLKNVRGRKAATGEKVYATRVGEILLNGETTNINGAGKFAYAADKLSEMFNASAIPANKVTPQAIEEAFFASMQVEFRSLSSTEIPEEHTFTYEREVFKKSPNDGELVGAPEKVKVTVRNVNYGKTEKTENKPAEKVEAKPESKAPAKKAEPKK